MTEDNIKRMNFLYHKSKESDGLTNIELTEQKKLRQEYLAAIRSNLRGQLDNISVQEQDGSITNLGEKYGNIHQSDSSK